MMRTRLVTWSLTALAGRSVLLSCTTTSDTQPSTHATVADSGVCGNLTCSVLGIECGAAPNTCGGVIQCGDCPSGQTCGGGGPNKCGVQPCYAKTCVQLGATCGLVSDGCANVAACGECPPGSTCTASASASICVAGDGGTEGGGAKPLGQACQTGTECESTYCVDGVCCDTACDGRTCERCDALSANGAGRCGYVSSSSADPENECTTASAPDPGSCGTGSCSGIGFSCGALSEGEHGMPLCMRCNGTSMDPVYFDDMTQDAEGANTCSQPHYVCSYAGACYQPTHDACVARPSGQPCSSVCPTGSPQACRFTSNNADCSDFWADCTWSSGSGYCACTVFQF